MKSPSLSLLALFSCLARAEVERHSLPPDEADRSMVAWYDFQANPDGTPGVPDRSGHGHDLAAHGAVGVTDGILGDGVRFRGGWLAARANPLAGAEAFTVSLWFKVPDPSANLKLVAAARWAGGNDASGWMVGTHYPEAWADDQAGSLRVEGGWTRSRAFERDKWNHLVLTCDGSRVREYVNGCLSVDVPASGRAVGEGVPMTVGSWNGQFGVNGAMDEMRLYRRCLTGAEVLDLARLGSAFEIQPPGRRVPRRARQPRADGEDHP